MADPRYDLIPVVYMGYAVRMYIEEGCPLGHFLTAVVEGDLYKAVAHADLENQRLLADWVKWFHNQAPSGCCMSKAAVADWIKTGGLKGRKENK